MSAQAVLSMIAPALPATPQGPSGADASAFQGLLAAMLANGDVAVDRSGTELAGSDVPPDGDGDEGAATESGLPGFLAMALPIAPDAAAPPAGSAASVPDEGPVTAGTVVPPVAEVATTSPFPAEEMASKTTKPLAPTDVVDAPPSSDGVPTTDGVDMAVAPPAADDVVAEPAKPAGAGGQPVPPPAPASPPPLRPLGDRTSRPDDAATTTTDGGKGAAGAPALNANVATAPTGSGPTAHEQAAKSSAAATAVAVDTAAPATADAAPVSEPAAPAADTAGSVREPALPTLSRATIDATAQIAAQIQRKLEGRSTRFEIALRPDELGRVDVKLDIDSEGRLAARLAFDNPAAATDLRGRVDDLRRQLENAGFQLADDAFEFAERDSGSSAFDRGQDSSRGQNRAFAAAARLNDEIDVAQPPRWMALTLSPSGVDMKV